MVKKLKALERIGNLAARNRHQALEKFSVMEYSAALLLEVVRVGTKSLPALRSLQRGLITCEPNSLNVRSMLSRR